MKATLTPEQRIKRLEDQFELIGTRCANILNSLAETTERLRVTNNHNVQIIDRNEGCARDAIAQLARRMAPLERFYHDSLFGAEDTGD